MVIQMTDLRQRSLMREYYENGKYFNFKMDLQLSICECWQYLKINKTEVKHVVPVSKSLFAEF